MPNPRLPKVTVLLPVYNAGHFLRPAIQSILDQTFTDFELLIVNDASTDDSQKVIESFTDPRIRVIVNRKNMHLLETLNIGLRAATGTYVARMDQDDIALPHRLACQVAFLDAHPDVGLVGAAVQLIDQHDRRGAVVRFPTRPAVVAWQLCFRNPIAHPTVVFRRQLVADLGNYTSSDLPQRDAHPSEDYELWRRLSQKAALVSLPDVLLLLRKHEHNLTQLHHESHLADARKISALAMTTVLGKPVEQKTVDALWLERYPSQASVQAAFDLVADLFITFSRQPTLLLADQRAIAFDASKRLYRLAAKPAAAAGRLSLWYRTAALTGWRYLWLAPIMLAHRVARRS